MNDGRNIKGFAVLGAGFAGSRYARAILENPGAALTHVIIPDRSLHRKQELAAGMGICDDRICSDFGRALTDPDTHVIVIATPHYAHMEQMKASVDAGKHFIVEKPVICDFAEVNETAALLRTCGVRHLSGHVCRYSTVFRNIKALIDSGELGDLTFVESDYIHNVSERIINGGKSWWKSDRIVEQGITGGAVHSVDLMRWTAGDIQEVHAVACKAVMKEVPFHDTVLASMRFESDAIGKVFLGLSAQRPYSINLSVYGTRGTAINNRLFLSSISGLEDFITLPITIEPEHPNFPQIVAHMLELLDNATEPIGDALEGLKSAAVCLAIALSLREQRSVRVEEILA